eukprot:gene118-125_t
MSWPLEGWLLTALLTLDNFVIFLAGFLLVFNLLDKDTQEDLLAMITGHGHRKDQPNQYPLLSDILPKEEIIEIHNEKLKNLFPSLENLETENTQDWLESQTEHTLHYFNHSSSCDLSVLKDTLKKEIHHAEGMEMPDTPVHYGASYFFFKKLHLQLPQYTLFMTPHLNLEAKPVLDPNTLIDPSIGIDQVNKEVSHDGNEEGQELLGQMITVHAIWISPDGFKLVYGYSKTGHTNEMSLAVRDLRTGEDSSIDIIHGCFVDYTSVSWIDSRGGFFYTTQLLVQPGYDHDVKNNAGEREREGSMEHAVGMLYSNRVYYHKIGSRQVHDLLVFEFSSHSDSITISSHITSDGHYLLLEIFKKRREITCNTLWRTLVNDYAVSSPLGNKVYYYDLCKFDGLYTESLGSCIKLVDTFAHRFEYISNIEDDFWFRTNYNAVNFRVVRVTLPEINSQDDDIETEAIRNKLSNSWKNCLDWIPARRDGDYLVSAGIAAHTILVLKYLKEGSHEVKLYDLTQNLEKESQIPVASLPHPSFGTIMGPNCSFYSSEIFYQFTGYSDPSSIYRASIDRNPFTGSISITFDEVNSTSLPGMDKYMCDVEQVDLQMSRNVSLPIQILGLKEDIEEIRQKKEDRRLSPKPTILLVNGGFGVCATPVFSLPLWLFVKGCHGLVMVTNLQGSGLYGSGWAKGGSKEDKENGVTDLLAVMKFIEEEGFTTPAQLCLYGGTFNGLLIGAALCRSPELFGAAVVEDGIFDLIRYHHYNPVFADSYSLADDRFIKESTWYQEFGCAEDSKDELMRLLRLSPLHNLTSSLNPSSLPAVLLTAALPPAGKVYSDSVSPVHSAKFIAQLQQLVGGKVRQSSDKPFLLYVTQDEDRDLNTRAGKNIERPYLGMTTEEMSTILAFIIKHTAGKWHE